MCKLSIHFFLLTSSTSNNIHQDFLLKEKYRIDSIDVFGECMAFNYTLNHLPHYNIKVLDLRIHFTKNVEIAKALIPICFECNQLGLCEIKK